MEVALLDSGIGGWSFLTKIEREYPNHNYHYFADQKNCPYGNKSLSELAEITDNWIKLFKEKQIDILILACNTMTAWFKQRFESQLNIPVFGTTDGLEKHSFAEGKVVLLATVKTVQSQWYQRIFPELDLFQVGNTWLAETIEEHFLLSNNELDLLKQQVEERAGRYWNTMILGCTHYPLIQEQLKIIWPNKLFINPADTISEELKPFLSDSIVANHKIIMYTSGDLASLKKQVLSFFDQTIQKRMTTAHI
ncbi:aspartate/glutamate racemase family protein [[Brevibacterium] frigoritolerans]|nr:aspartate/glutamate racemase family protein [Peribacillus frigoritolerans]